MAYIILFRKILLILAHWQHQRWQVSVFCATAIGICLCQHPHPLCWIQPLPPTVPLPRQETLARIHGAKADANKQEHGGESFWVAALATMARFLNKLLTLIIDTFISVVFRDFGKPIGCKRFLIDWPFCRHSFFIIVFIFLLSCSVTKIKIIYSFCKPFSLWDSTCVI